MRIAITGAQGVGKSTVCELLKKKIELFWPNNKCSIIGNISRSLLKRKLVQSDTKSTIEDYYLYNTEYIKGLLNTDSDIIIHDRTLLDSLAYQLFNNNASPRYYSMIKEITKWYILGIDYYYVLPIEIPIEDDGVRNLSYEYQDNINRLMISLLHDYHIDWREVRGTVEERVNEIMESIKIDMPQQ